MITKGLSKKEGDVLQNAFSTKAATVGRLFVSGTWSSLISAKNGAWTE